MNFGRIDLASGLRDIGLDLLRSNDLASRLAYCRSLYGLSRNHSRRVVSCLFNLAVRLDVIGRGHRSAGLVDVRGGDGIHIDDARRLLQVGVCSAVRSLDGKIVSGNVARNGSLHSLERYVVRLNAAFNGNLRCVVDYKIARDVDFL